MSSSETSEGLVTTGQGATDVIGTATDGARRFDPIVAALAQVIRERHIQEQQARDRRLGLRVVPTQGGWAS
jgi:hypothetical protein